MVPNIDALPQPGRKTFASLGAVVLGMLACLCCGYFALSASQPSSDVAAVPATQPPAGTPASQVTEVAAVLPSDTPAPPPTDTPTNTPTDTPIPPSATPTPTNVPPSETPTPMPTNTRTSTPVPTPTNTPLPPTSTPTFTPAPTPAVTFGVSPNPMPAGQCATLSWTVASAQAVYLSGGQFGGLPGQGVPLHNSVTICPPASTTYVLRVNSAYGSSDTPRMLQVTSPTLTPSPSPTRVPTILIDLVNEAPSAAWFNGNGALPWPGDPADSRGFAVWWQGNETMEDGSRPPLVLETHPQWVTDGYIGGYYPRAITLRAADRMRLLVGFIQGASAGDVTYDIRFSYACNGEFNCEAQVDQFEHAYNGSLVSHTIDLSAQAGRTGKFYIYVHAGSSSAQDWASWAIARVERP